MRIFISLLLMSISISVFGQAAQDIPAEKEAPAGYERFKPTTSGQPVPWDKSKVFIIFFDRFFILPKRDAVDYLESYLGYLKNLKSCNRSNHIIKNSFTAIKEEFKINGWKGDYCQVKYIAYDSVGDCRIMKDDIPILLEKRKSLTRFTGFEGLSRDEDGVYLKSCRYEPKEKVEGKE